MDLVLGVCDHHFLSPYIYPSSWKEDDPLRQIISILLIINLGGYLLYFFFSTLSFYLIYDHRLLKHPQILENQIQKEIMVTVKSVPLMSGPTAVLFFLEVRGYSKLYEDVQSTRLGYSGVLISVVTFILFTDMCIYWIHRFLHHKAVYKHLHKVHHRWKVPTPFASHAFHPVDGFLQSIPYHIYPFLFPLHKVTYLALFVFVNLWTISIHDADFRVPDALKPVVNGAAHHTDHHLFYNYNYGQYFTLWDRLGGSFRNPSAFEGDGPLEQMLVKGRHVNGDGGGCKEATGSGRQENGDVKKEH